MERLTVNITADHIDWKELIEKINDAIKEDVTDINSVDILYEECIEDENEDIT